MMNEREKSDGVVVPAKPSNKTERSGAETVEGRTPAKGNSFERNALRTQSRDGAQSALARVREAAKKDRKQRTGGCDRSACPCWRTSSSSGPPCRC
jgi:hypothetical protein